MARAGKICISVLVLISLLSLFAPLISGYDPNGIDLDSLREPPGSEHLFGTDSKGRDIFTRILYGAGYPEHSSSRCFLSLSIGLILGLCRDIWRRVDMFSYGSGGSGPFFPCSASCNRYYHTVSVWNIYRCDSNRCSRMGVFCKNHQRPGSDFERSRLH